MRFVTAAAFSAAAALLSSPASAQVPVPPPTPTATAPAQTAATPVPGERVVGIRVLGYQTVSPDTIAHYLGIKVGDPYDAAKIRENFQTLWNVGLLENVAIEAEHSAAGVTLVVTIEERPTIKAVEFTGNKKFSTSQIRDRLKEANVAIHAGAPLSLRDVAHVRAVIADYYAENGYRSATVDYRIEDISKTDKKVIFAIDEGDKIKIAAIHFQGNHVFAEWQLRQAMKQTKVNTWFRLLSEASTTYSQANYDADVENLKKLYQSKGYKNIVVKDAILAIYVKNPRAAPKKQKKRVRVTIPLVEGDRFFTSEIRIVKVEQSGQPVENPDEPMVFPRESLKKEFFELRPGKVLNRDYLVEALARIETRYKSRGYIYWFADPVYREVGQNRVDVDVHIFEGEKFYLGRLEVKGNATTRDKVIRREFTLDEGDVMNMEAVKKSLQKLQQLGYFKIAEEPDFSVRQAEKKVDITVKGTETSRNEIQFGAGYSGLDGFFGQFSFQTRNFLGRGEILGVSAQLGKVSKYYNLSYTVPWFLDRNQTVGASIFRSNTTYLNIFEDRRGASTFYGRGIGLFDAWSTSYQYEDVNATFPVIAPAAPPGQPVPPQTFSVAHGLTSSVTPSYRYDSLNDPFDPNQGSRVYASSQVAGGVLGGSFDFVKPIVGASGYLSVPFPRHGYVGFSLQAGYILPYSGNTVPIFERFQLGGEQTLRGFRAGAVIPLKDNEEVFTDSVGRILGGNKFFVVNLEYVFLAVGPAKLLVFTDVGNTYFETQKFDLTRIRSSVGAELRIFLPIFQAPLRFIYSFVLDPKAPIDQFGRPIANLKDRPSGFDFSIGRTF
ncbi:MAG: outer membrane protein assembly factor BamA [Thermoanaerobaculia bacterium]